MLLQQRWKIWNEVGLDKSERKKMNNKIEEDK